MVMVCVVLKQPLPKSSQTGYVNVSEYVKITLMMVAQSSPPLPGPKYVQLVKSHAKFGRTHSMVTEPS